MTALKNFLVFGICVAATVLLAQAAVGANRADAAKPAARVSTNEPARHSANVNTPNLNTPARHSAKANTPARRSANATSPARMRVQFSPLGRIRPGTHSLQGPRR
jgi:hypothetical protein